MSLLTLDQIQTYSSCPRQFGYREKVSVGTAVPNIIHELIKQSYINRSQHGYDPQWDTIKTRVNKHFFGPIDIKDKEVFGKAYKASVTTIDTLHGWYYNTFQNDLRHGIANVPLTVEVSHSTVVAVVDLVLFSNQGPVPVVFSHGESILSLANNIKYKSLLWLIWKETGELCRSTEWVSGVQYHKVHNKTPMDTVERMVNFIVRGIENKIYYPSVNSQCNSCEFRQICVL